MDKGGQVDVVFTDFQRAIDKVSHSVMITKIHSIGLSDDFIRRFICILLTQIGLCYLRENDLTDFCSSVIICNINV